MELNYWTWPNNNCFLWNFLDLDRFIDSRIYGVRSIFRSILFLAVKIQVANTRSRGLRYPTESRDYEMMYYLHCLKSIHSWWILESLAYARWILPGPKICGNQIMYKELLPYFLFKYFLNFRYSQPKAEIMIYLSDILNLIIVVYEYQMINLI